MLETSDFGKNGSFAEITKTGISSDEEIDAADEAEKDADNSDGKLYLTTTQVKETATARSSRCGWLAIRRKRLLKQLGVGSRQLLMFLKASDFTGNGNFAEIGKTAISGDEEIDAADDAERKQPATATARSI